jgi:GT2 family glycosyltransferase
VWDALGGLDSVFAPAWWEDVDFCARLATSLRDGDLAVNAGFVVEPRARVEHDGGSSVASLGDAAFLAAYYRNLVRFTARHHPDRLPLIRAGLRGSLAARAILRPRRAKAYREALRAIGER